jgi:two-component system sensor kinase FixL
MSVSMARLGQDLSGDLTGPQPSRVLGCAIALGAAAAGLAARLLLAPWLGEREVFLFFVPAVVMASAYAGLIPGVFAAALGLAGGLLATALVGHLALGDVLSAGVYGLTAGAVVTGGEWFQRERRRAARINRELSQDEAHLKSILATVPDAMIVIDERGHMSSYSAAAERLFGWTPEETLGRNVSMLMPSPDHDAHDGYLARYRATGERRIIGLPREVTGLRKDGSQFPMELAVGEARTDDDRLFIGFARDLSERQAAETRMRQLQGELVQISRLTAMGEMASAIAHELNQPLSAIANYLKGSTRLLARAEPPRAQVTEALAKAADQALRAGDIIRRLREFVARGETERRVEDLSEVIEEARTLAMVGAKARGVHAQFRYDPGVGRVLIDKVQVQQVVLNLIRNAIDAMEDAPRRDLEVMVSMGPAGYAEVSVADSGPGISEEAMARLFQPFFTTKAEGMGVGLSISRTIVEAHGGRIWAEPTPGGGATFHFTLRAIDGDAADD